MSNNIIIYEYLPASLCQSYKFYSIWLENFWLILTFSVKVFTSSMFLYHLITLTILSLLAPVIVSYSCTTWVSFLYLFLCFPPDFLAFADAPWASLWVVIVIVFLGHVIPGGDSWMRKGTKARWLRSAKRSWQCRGWRNVTSWRRNLRRSRRPERRLIETSGRWRKRGTPWWGGELECEGGGIVGIRQT